MLCTCVCVFIYGICNFIRLYIKHIHYLLCVCVCLCLYMVYATLYWYFSKLCIVPKILWLFTLKLYNVEPHSMSHVPATQIGALWAILGPLIFPLTFFFKYSDIPPHSPPPNPFFFYYFLAFNILYVCENYAFYLIFNKHRDMFPPHLFYKHFIIYVHVFLFLINLFDPRQIFRWKLCTPGHILIHIYKRAFDYHLNIGDTTFSYSC